MSENIKSYAHIAEIMGKLERVGTRCGCWYSDNENGFFSANINGNMISISNETGFGYIEITPNTINNLKSVVGFDGAKELLSKERRRFEDAIRTDKFNTFADLLCQFTGEWHNVMDSDDRYIDGIPSEFYREKPSDNGNGWWAGDRLVYEYATKAEVAEIKKIARRRLEDKLRKDPEFFLQVVV